MFPSSTEEIEMAVKRGSGVLFFDANKGRVLLFLRDNKPNIPFPNMLDILGGGVEDGETAEEAVTREMAEELEDKRTELPFVLKDPVLFKVYIDERGTEQNIYCAPANFEINDLVLKEGQRLEWMTEQGLQSTKLAFDFNEVVSEFFLAVRT
jgi:8-oxo-dGTP diphosphatase